MILGNSFYILWQGLPYEHVRKQDENLPAKDYLT